MAAEAGAGAPSRDKSVLHALWRVVVSTVGACVRNRVTGLAAEAAFFAILSLPPLIFGLAGSIGYFFDRVSTGEKEQFITAVLNLSEQVLTAETVEKIVAPTLRDVVSGGRFEIISIGFVLALWSGSRALNVFVDTVTIMYGLGGKRGIVKTRMLSFSLYTLGLVTGVMTVPLLLAGPGLVDRALPERFDALNQLYWPAVVVLSICFLATLYHVSVPVRTSWRYNLPGAVFTMVVWIFGSSLLRWFLTASAKESTSIYGPLAAPIAVLVWLYLLAIAVLIGAALNAAFDQVWPEAAVAHARRDLVRRLRQVPRWGWSRPAGRPGATDETGPVEGLLGPAGAVDTADGLTSGDRPYRGPGGAPDRGGAPVGRANGSAGGQGEASTTKPTGRAHRADREGPQQAPSPATAASPPESGAT